MNSLINSDTKSIQPIKLCIVKGNGQIPIKREYDTNDDYSLLLNLYMGMSKEKIASNRCLTVNDINNKIKQIAYKRLIYTELTPDEIMNETKLTMNDMEEVIKTYRKITKYQTKLNDLYIAYPIASPKTHSQNTHSSFELAKIERNLTERLNLLNTRIDDMCNRMV